MRVRLLLSAVLVIFSQASFAQFSSDYQTNVISGVTSNWAGDYFVGNTNLGDVLVIQNGGVLSNRYGFVGYSVSDSNAVLITGGGSMWINEREIAVGSSGRVNRVTIELGGHLSCSNGFVGVGLGTSNLVTVTGVNSCWDCSNSLIVGWAGGSNNLVVFDGALVVSAVGELSHFSGFGDTGQNVVRVMDGGAWRTSNLNVGGQGSNAMLIVAGGSVFATNMVVGVNSLGCGNAVELNSGSIIVTNADATAVLEVRHGKLLLNGGVLQVDQLIITNGCAAFVRTGGTLTCNSVILDPAASAVGDGIPNGWKQQYGLDPFDPDLASRDTDGDGCANLQEYLAGTDPTNNAASFHIVSVAREGNDVRVAWQTGIGKTNALQRAASLDGNYVDLVGVTNTTGAVTNYLDKDAVTNAPNWFYRVRIVP